MSILSLIYKALGSAFVVLSIACLVEKYRTVRGGTLLPARVVDCEKCSAASKKNSGGWRYAVELSVQGGRHKCYTNDCFWVEHKNKKDQTILVWYNPARPGIVERKSPEAEVLSGIFGALGIAMILFL